jgi:dipeptidyl aminopeptidase/acylaminoacyl peptidase
MASSRYALLHRLPKDPAHILIAKYHWADNGKGKVHRLNIENGRLDYTADEPSGDIRGLGADTEGRVRIAVETLEGKSEDDERTFLHVRGVGESKWTKLDLAAKRKRVAFQPVGFSADGQRAYFLSNFDQEKQDRLGLFEYDFQSKKVDLVHREADVDLAGPLLGANGEVLGVFHLGGRGEQLLMDDRVKHGQFINMLVQAFKGQHVSVTSYSDDGNQAIVRVRSDRNPGEFYLFDLDTRKATFLEASLPKIKAKQMLETEPVVIAANDGMRLHALLTRPASKAKQLPLIINVHGGPFGVTDFWGFHPESQFFASRGYAVLQVNYRGSGNRGSDFERAGYRQWGTRMQQDLVDATEWAIKEGIADPKRVCIYGGSYGGYAALWGVIKDPDLYRCAVGIVGVYDLVQFRKGDGSDFNRFGGDYFEKFMKARVGEDPEALRAVSPVHHVDKIKAELFIIHGEKDVRVPVEHAYRLRDALKKVNKNFEWMIKPEGHGFYDVNNRVDMYTQVLAFFEKHIGKAQ